MRKLTENQERYCRIWVEQDEKPKSKRLTRGQAYTLAGYTSKTPEDHAAPHARKKHIVERIAMLRAERDGIELPEEPELTPLQQAMADLRGFSKESADGAWKRVQAELKVEVDLAMKDAMQCLLAAISPDEKNAEYADKLPDNTIAAYPRDAEPTGAGEPEKSEGVANE